MYEEVGNINNYTVGDQFMAGGIIREREREREMFTRKHHLVLELRFDSKHCRSHFFPNFPNTTYQREERFCSNSNLK